MKRHKISKRLLISKRFKNTVLHSKKYSNAECESIHRMQTEDKIIEIKGI